MNKFSILKNMFTLRGNLKKSRKKILALQEKKFRKLLNFAFENSEYYKNIFVSSGLTKQDLKTIPLNALPTLDKKTLLSNFDKIATIKTDSKNLQEEMRQFDENPENQGKLFKNSHHIVHSSGSTGKPSYFLYDKSAWNTMLSGIIRAALWEMSDFEIVKFLAQKPKILFVAATDGRYGGAMAVGDGISGAGAVQLALDINMPLSVWEEKLKNFKPDMIIGYPTAIKILSDLAQNKKISLNPKRIVTCGEPLGKNLRQHFESIFLCKIVNFYGASESLALGVESDSQKGMILFDDLNIIESTNDGIFVTCLYNFAQPLIRYKLSDKIEVLQPDENLPKIRPQFVKTNSIIGRNEDLLWFTSPDGQKEFLHPLAVEGICIEGLTDYQFQKTSEQSFEMLVAVSNYENELQKKMIKITLNEFLSTLLKEKSLSFVNYKIKFIKTLKPNPKTGKKSLILAS